MFLAKSEKQKLSETRRLEAVKQRQRERSTRQRQIAQSLGNVDGSSLQNKKIVFHSDEEDNDINQEVQDKKSLEKSELVKDRLTLFESSDSEKEDDESHRFEIKSQFEGEKGRQLFEMSSGFTDERFKLDERFKEKDVEDMEDSGAHEFFRNEQDDEVAAEKEKNLEILEKVLGFQVPKKPLTAAVEKRKKLIRFDPDCEDTSKFIRKTDPESDKKEKTKSKKDKVEKASNLPEPVVSSQRYFEVVGDLKELLDDSAAPEKPFSFSHRFGFQGTENEDESSRSGVWGVGRSQSETTANSNSFLPLNSSGSSKERTSQVTAVPKRIQRGPKFFLGSDDPRLKDGVEHFCRKIPLEKVRENWLVTRETVLDLFKKNRRSSLKNPKIKSRSFQPKRYQNSRHRRFIRK